MLMTSLSMMCVGSYQYQHPNAKLMVMNGDPTSGFINVRLPPYNATGDGITDDTNAIQRALNDTGSMGGGIVFIPEGNYLIASHLTLPAATVLKGVASHVQRNWGDPNRKSVFGTTLLAIADAGNENGTAFISLSGDSSGIEGLQIFYPNQVPRNPPIAYPWTIRCGQQGKSIENNYVKNVLLVNPWKGIDAATYEAPRHWFENVYGQPLAIGIAVDQCYDIGRISHIHFWPFWSSELELWNWVNNNGITFLFQRTDWEVVEDVFSWGYQIGMAFRTSAYGACNGQFTDINFDNVDIGIEVSYTQTWGILFSNLNLANAGGGSNRIGILGRAINSTKPTDASVVVRGASFWGVFHQTIVWSHVGLISISDSLFAQWNKTSPGIEIQRGRAMINNNYFGDNVGNAVTVLDGADRVTITNNHFNGNRLNVVTKPTVLVANNLE
ncbi:unnamed protein product [Rotaria socialis]|uniref:Rhamnogalacturonase A/B/Epimerase-like pectate lyase domain-containing protein n=2 Tax=Rotaria socialis TaxID=392032 RepID=A0A817UKS2_9BILA|nr:unnamed protein product [Rotaria socialis]